ncbi:MAG: phosphatase PAP2 family protein [Bacteroidales bacterium]|nr:phosphatase PAP2 family protein [Bacteroidales bacterium]
MIDETLLAAGLFTTILKYSVNRDRPFITYPYIEKLTSSGPPSFPSGHSSECNNLT